MIMRMAGGFEYLAVPPGGLPTETEWQASLRRRAVRYVASEAESAEDARELLAMLGLSAAEGK